MRPVIYAIFLLSAVTLTTCEFLPQRLRIIDSNVERNTFLVRGNLPIDSHKKFQFDQLKGNLSAITGANRYRLVVISFLNSLTAKEAKNKDIQDRFFEQNKQADYQTWTILGSPFDPAEIPWWAADILGFLGSVFDFDNVDVLVEQLHDQLYKNRKNTIIYIHCSAGVDRTGYVAGSYKMKYMGASLRKVHAENLQVLDGLRNYMHFNSENGMQWFCYSLGRTQEECSLP